MGGEGAARRGDSNGIDVDDGRGTARTQPATRRELSPLPRASSGSVNLSMGGDSALGASTLDARDASRLDSQCASAYGL